MIIPPITLYEEDQALLEVLKALAQKEAALATYSSAEANKLQSLIECLENQRSPALTSESLAGIIESSSSSLETAHLMQTMLQSNLQHILKHLNAEPLYQLVSLPIGKCCTLTAHGQGQVLNKNDPFHLGMAQLIETSLSAKNGDDIRGSIKYRVELNGHFEELETVSSDLRLGFVGPIAHRASPSRPNIALITGYGVVKKSISAAECVRGLAWFALTLWDYGSRKKQGKFRMTVCNPQNSSFNHDSNIILQ